jgi:chromosomal replication initiator protein
MNEMRNVLISRAELLNFPLQEKVLEYLLAAFSRNTKTLIRSLEALILRTHLSGSTDAAPVSLETARKHLEDLAKAEQQSVITPAKIIQTVAEYYGIKADDILGKAQSRDCALPRQIAMHICRNQLRMPYMKIGDLFSRDHSTVMASVKQVQKSMEAAGSEVSSIITGILKQLKAAL